jgi:hypothetical protein
MRLNQISTLVDYPTASERLPQRFAHSNFGLALAYAEIGCFGTPLPCGPLPPRRNGGRAGLAQAKLGGVNRPKARKAFSVLFHRVGADALAGFRASSAWARERISAADRLLLRGIASMACVKPASAN